MVDGKVVIARILHGGLIHKQGLLQVGDRIVKVNHEEVGSMTPLELQDMLVGVFVVVVVVVYCSVNHDENCLVYDLPMSVAGHKVITETELLG